MMTEKRFWEIVDEYPKQTKGYQVGNFRFDAELDEYSFHDGIVTFHFKDESELRKILEDFEYNES